MTPSTQLLRDGMPNAILVAEALELRTQGRLAEALELLEGAEFSADLYTLRGDFQFELGHIQDAAGSYSTVLAFSSGHLYARFRLALALRRLERWDAAAEALRALLEEDSHRDDARIVLGECLLHLNRPEEALACFDRCWSESAQPRALFGKAVALQLLGRLEESESAYSRLVVLDPSAAEAWSNLIALSAARRDLAAVNRYALRLLELDPQSHIALRGLLLVSLERAELEQAALYHSRLHSVPGGDSEQPRTTDPAAASASNGSSTGWRPPPGLFASDQPRTTETGASVGSLSDGGPRRSLFASEQPRTTETGASVGSLSDDGPRRSLFASEAAGLAYRMSAKAAARFEQIRKGYAR